MSQSGIESQGAGRYLISGDLDKHTVPVVWQQARTLLARESDNLCIDLQAVGRCDSAGVALLIEWMREAQARALSISFINLPEQMHAIAKVSGIDSLLPIETS